MAFKRLTKQQADCYEALRALGTMVIGPNDERPIKALKARGIARVIRIEGVRHVTLRAHLVDKPERAKLNRVPEDIAGLVDPLWKGYKRDQRMK